MLLDEESVIADLEEETQLTKEEAIVYIGILKEGSLPATKKGKILEKLQERGMVILSGDNRRYIPVHPRLAIANHFRTWREQMVHEINQRRMRVDKLILRLIPVYEATMEKKLDEGR